MLIDVNANRFEDRKLPALRRQGLQGRRIKLCKRSRAATWQLLKRPCVEVLQQRHYCRIDFIDSLKALVAKPHHDPALHHLNGRLHLGFVLRTARSGRQDRAAIVTRKVLHRGAHLGLIPVRLADHGLGVVGHDQLRHAAKEVQRFCSGPKPIGHRLSGCSVGKGVARCAQSGHIDMRLCSISEFDGGARKVDEQLFSGAVHHAQRAFEAFNVVAVIDAELRVLVHTLAGVTLHKLLPQQHDGHAFAAHLMMQMAKVWPNKVLWWGCWRDEPSLQFSLT